MKTSELQNTGTSNIEWHDGQPYSAHFQDIYFSTDDGLAETDYVFLQGNDLFKRFQQLDSTQFIIIETGFGTGLNFLCTARLWLNQAPTTARLHFISTEKYPLSLNDIAVAHKLWPDLALLSTAFLTQYQSLLHDSHISLFDNRIQLTLLIGEAKESLECLNVQADAWFLDGFAPAKNPEMWQPALFQQMAKLSIPGTTFATFTSAGNVRRGLQTAGFDVSKQVGYGKKREMLIGHFPGK